MNETLPQLPPKIEERIDLIQSGTFKRTPILTDSTDSKVQRRVLSNNLYVQITSKYPHIARSQRKKMAKTIAYARIKELTDKNRAAKVEMDALREQDYAEAAPPEKDIPA